MLFVAVSLLVGLFQAPQTGTVVGLVKLPNGAKPNQAVHVVLLPSKYIEVWNKLVQERLDNYWEIFKPELAVNKERITDVYRMVHVESFRSITSTMRRDMGVGAANFVKDASAGGQFEFRGIPLGTYQVLVQTTSGGEDIVWARTINIENDIPIFVDLGKPVS
jgi:hypothetical protein